MKKFIPALIIFLFAALRANCQSTTVSGAVTDAASQTWNSGTISFRFIPVPNYSGPYSWTGGAFNPNTAFNASLSGTGTYSLSVPSNSAITPTGSSWQVTVCPQATAPCFSTPAIISGATQTLNVTPTAIQVAPGANNAVYATSEVVGASIGAQIYLIGTGLETFDGSAWHSAGGGGTVTSVTASAPLASSGGATPNITAGTLPNSPSPSSTYTFFMSSTSDCLTPVRSSGTTVCARNNLTSAIDYSGSDVAAVWTSVVTALATTGGHIYFKNHAGGYPANSATLESATGCSNFVGSGNALAYVLGFPSNTPFSSAVEWTIEGEDAGVWQGEAGSTSSNNSGTYINVTATAVSSVASGSFIAGWFVRPITNCTLTPTNSSNSVTYKNIGIRFPTNTRGNEGGFISWFAASIEYEGTTIADFALPYNTIATGSAPVAGTVGSFGFTSTLSSSGNLQVFRKTFAAGWRLCYDFQSEHILGDLVTAIYCNNAANFGRSGTAVYHPSKIRHFVDQENLNGVTFGAQMQQGSRVDFDSYDLELGASNWYARTTGTWTETNPGYTSGIVLYSAILGGTGLVELPTLFSSGGANFQLVEGTAAPNIALTQVSDTFTHPNQTGLGPAWSADVGSFNIVSNAAVAQVNASYNHYAARAALNGDQFARVTASTVSATSQFGPGIRWTSGSGGNGDLCAPINGTNQLQLFKVIAGAFTSLSSPAYTPVNGDTIELDGYGSQIVCNAFRAGATVATATGTDATNTSGLPWMYSNAGGGATPTLTNFSAGSLPTKTGADSIYTQPFPPILAGGVPPVLTGTGACATITTQVGAWAGTFKCTGTTGAATVTMTWPSNIATNGWVCSAQDESTSADTLKQTSHSATTCILTAAAVAQNDVFVFTGTAF